MRTIKEWFATLPDDIRERAYNNIIAYCDNAKKYMLKSLEPTLYDAISGAFIWKGTPEGHEFWLLVATSKFDEAQELLTNNTTKP